MGNSTLPMLTLHFNQFLGQKGSSTLQLNTFRNLMKVSQICLDSSSIYSLIPNTQISTQSWNPSDPHCHQPPKRFFRRSSMASNPMSSITARTSKPGSKILTNTTTVILPSQRTYMFWYSICTIFISYRVGYITINQFRRGLPQNLLSLEEEDLLMSAYSDDITGTVNYFKMNTDVNRKGIPTISRSYLRSNVLTKLNQWVSPPSSFSSLQTCPKTPQRHLPRRICSRRHWESAASGRERVWEGGRRVGEGWR